MRNITVIGVGYVGLSTAACLAQLGHRVVGFDCDDARIRLLRNGGMPLVEPGLPEIVESNVRERRLSFVSTWPHAMRDAEIAFICVATPTLPTGEADLRQIEAATRAAVEHARRPVILVLKSTATPTGIVERMAQIAVQHGRPGIDVRIVVNPEFLREGSAVKDFLKPDRVVLGARSTDAAEIVASLYAQLDCPVVLTDPHSAQLAKYAANAFLATKISFINEIATIAERVGANIHAVAAAMGFDERIGHQFLESGLGFGGSCFPKDVAALTWMAEKLGSPSHLLQAVTAINVRQRRLAIEKLDGALHGLDNRTVCVLGLAFKANTDDVREAPAIDVVRVLCERGANVRAFDPIAVNRARGTMASTTSLRYFDDAYDALSGSDAVFIATDWPQFRALDWQRVCVEMNGRTIVDARGILRRDAMEALGFKYVGFAS